MKYSNIIRMLKSHNNLEVNPHAAKKCFANLPEVLPVTPVTPLLKQQLTYFPKWFYTIGGLFYTILFIKRNSLSIDMMLQYSSALIYLMIALLGMHILMSSQFDVKEIEYSCKYQYSHIILTRMFISVSYIVLLGLLVNFLLWITFSKIKLIWNFIIFLPVFAGLACTLFILLLPLNNFNTDFAAFGVLIVVSTVGNRILYEIRNNTEYHLEPTLTIVFIACALLIVSQCHYLIERRFLYETYNM